MARSQTQRAKDEFFASLDRLCESDDDSHDSENITAAPTSHEPPRSYLPRGNLELDYVRDEAVTKARDTPLILTTEVASESRHDRPDQQPPSSNIPSSSDTAQNHGKRRRGTAGTSGSMKGSVVIEPDPLSRRRIKKVKDSLQCEPEAKQIFKDLVFFFVPNDDIAKPRKTRILKAQEHGAYRATSFNDTVTHVIVEPHIKYVEAAKAFPNRQIPTNALLVKCTWLTESLSSMFLRDPLQSRFQVIGAPTPSSDEPLPKSVLQSEKAIGTTKAADGAREISADLPSNIDQVFETTSPIAKEADAVSITSESESFGLEDAESLSSEVPETNVDPISSPRPDAEPEISEKEGGHFICLEPSSTSNGNNPNSKTILVLEEMLSHYDRTGDRWRTTAYRKAINVLRRQTTLIATCEQAVRIPQIGSRLAEKIEEIVTTTQLRHLESVKVDPHTQTLHLFMGIYGVGYKQASQWIAQGYETLADLLEKASLTTNQRIGIERYEDFQQRIPRAEVTQHATIVQDACNAADKDLRVIIGGSYRRGNITSGDIDLLVTKVDSDMSQICNLVTSKVIPTLTATGFLKCVLASAPSGHTDDGTKRVSDRRSSSSKWHGASCLPTSTTWRRIDLLFVPGHELGAALLYFTGDDIFNRSMRLLASRKGMCLNQHGLYQDVVRGSGRVKLTRGTLLESESERKIFDLLGVPWREPWERKC